jgi:hypothetical protein
MTAIKNTTFSNEMKVILNHKFAATINAKRKEALKMCVAIKDYFQEELGITLPRYKKGVFEYKHKYNTDQEQDNAYDNNVEIETIQELDWIFEDSSKVRTKANTQRHILKENEVSLKDEPIQKNTNHHDFWKYDEYGDALYKAYGDLARMYYNLILCSIKAEAQFMNPDTTAPNTYETQLMACVYSKHRLDPIWNYRKSKLIRKKYTDYLQETQIHKKYLPIHLTLTVPHKDGAFRGKRYYGTDLIACFNLLRKTETWKKYIHAGEYGLETKPSKNHGLHIHIHSLCFQNPDYPVSFVANKIVKEWKRITDNKTEYSGLHYESLYFYKKVEGTKDYVKEAKWQKDREGEWKETIVKKKHYITTESSNEDYIHGIMECIKYHFKHDIFAKDSNQYGGYDIPFLAEVCRESRSKRLYSRFGAFYKESKLNFNNLESDGLKEESKLHSVDLLNCSEPDLADMPEWEYDEEKYRAEEQEEKDILAKMEQEHEALYERVQRSVMDEAIMCEKEAQLINPFTGQPAYRFEYNLIIGFQNSGRRMSKQHQYRRDYTQSEHIYKLDMKKTFSELWALVLKGQLKAALAPEEQNKLSLKDINYVPAHIQEAY